MSNPAEASPAEAPAPRARARRPELERDHPIRHFSSVFREAEPQRAEAQAPPGGAAVSRAVELGYRVIDEYIRQGQKAASRMREGRVNTESLQADVEELGMRMAQHASDFAAMFGELLTRGGLGSEGKGEAPAPASPADAPPASEPRASAGAAPAPSAPAHTQLRIAMVSARAAEVSVDLQPGAATRPLIAHALRLYQAEGEPEGVRGRITDVAFEPGVPPTLRLRIAPTCAAGTYHGLLIDPDSSLPVGTLCVRVLEEPAL